MKSLWITCTLWLFIACAAVSAQPLSGGGGEDDKKKKEDNRGDYKPLTLTLNDDGSQYIRFLLWNQFWLQSSNLSAENSDLRITPQVRRARMLAYAQISPRFLILTHFGINSETAAGHHPLGEGSDVNLFFHDIWGEYKLHDNHYVGMGLHYWNGLSRMGSQSTLNFMTMDAPILNWAQLGLSDQFARHLGVYAKGNIGKLQYRVSLNDALSNTLDIMTNQKATFNQAVYAGRSASPGGNDNRFVAQGYFHYELLDGESYKLPFFVGTYLGAKKVLNIGAGFFHHTGGTTSLLANGDNRFHNVNHYSVDVFYDAPVGNKGMAINAYLVYYNFDFGPNYYKSAANPGNQIATGSAVYGQFGLLMPGQGMHDRFMPYVTYSHASGDVFSDNSQIYKLGLNYFMNGHFSKLTLEYDHRNTPLIAGGQAKQSFLTLQMHVFL